MKRILVVDDQPQVRKILKKQLEREGFEVTVASDGREGVMKYYDNPFDLVIMDIVMPEKEGIESICELKKNIQTLKSSPFPEGEREPQVTIWRWRSFLGRYILLRNPFIPISCCRRLRML